MTGMWRTGQHVILAGIATALVIACGTSELPTAEPEARPVASVESVCTAGDSTDEFFTSEPRPGWITIRVPRLPGWTMSWVNGSSPGFVVNRFDHPTDNGSMGTAMVTIATFSALSDVEAALAHLTRVRATAPGWRQSSSENVDVCGVRGRRITGTATSAGIDIHYEYLELAFRAGTAVHPIQVSSQVKVGDLPRYRTDLHTILGGVQIGF
ncbi:hypothetical protein [Nocardia sp. NPDC005366]|uniref:hypothetical protein n=1 Tax=Nocardia sp. NPDC005366 TaxID=3156878 RepID=UPI0033BAB1C1